jgi:soluble lytic murein transglycosylase-like protein
MKGITLRVPSLARLAPIALGLLSLTSVPSFLQKGAEEVTRKGAEVAATLPGMPAAELEKLARVAAWLSEASTGEDKISEVIAKDPKTFELFAGAHDAAQAREVLDEVPFGDAIADAAGEHAVDSLLVAAVVEVESTFDPKAGSHKGAVGLMQLLPSTAGMSRKRLLEPDANLDAGAAYLAEMIERFDGDLTLALAAYNAGPTNVRRYEGVPPFPETEQYVEKVLTRYVQHHLQLWQVAQGIDLGSLAA